MPGENNEIVMDMAGAVDSISDGLGFGADTPDDSVADSSNLDGGGGSLPAATPPPAEAPADVEGTPAPTEEAQSAAVGAPRTWRPEAAAEWDKLPQAVQAEIQKREEDIFKGIEGYKADAAYGKTMQGVMAPYEQVMKQYNIDPVAQVSDMMSAHYTLALGTSEQKTELFQRIAKDYGIDLAQVFGQQAPDQNLYIDPEVLALRKELASVKSVTTTIQQERLQNQKQTIETEVAQFAADPSNVHFGDVVKDMAHLIQTNQAASVKEAYEKAIWLNPAVRAKEISRQQAEGQAKAAKEAEAKAAAARKALGANVRSSAKSGGAAAPLGSMDDTIAATLANIKARS